MKAAKEDAKVAQIFRENSAKNTPRQNEFEAWCSSALANLNGQVDIPTFMAFLKDIESPYEVRSSMNKYMHFKTIQRKKPLLPRNTIIMTLPCRLTIM